MRMVLTGMRFAPEERNVYREQRLKSFRAPLGAPRVAIRGQAFDFAILAMSDLFEGETPNEIENRRIEDLTRVSDWSGSVPVAVNAGSPW